MQDACRLPHEIFDHILDIVDLDLLGTTSLVCHRWMLRSRSRSFGELTLTSSSGDQFLRLISSPLNTFTQIQVHTLRVREHHLHGASGWLRKNAHLLSSLPFTTLVLSTLAFPIVLPPAISTRLVALWIDLQSSEPLELDTLNSVLPSFSSLKNLSLVFPSYIPRHLTVTQPHPALPIIESLTVVVSNGFPIGILTALYHPRQLHLVHLYTQDTKALDVLNSALRDMGSELHHLTIFWSMDNNWFGKSGS